MCDIDLDNDPPTSKFAFYFRLGEESLPIELDLEWINVSPDNGAAGCGLAGRSDPTMWIHIRFRIHHLLFMLRATLSVHPVPRLKSNHDSRNNESRCHRQGKETWRSYCSQYSVAHHLRLRMYLFLNLVPEIFLSKSPLHLYATRTLPPFSVKMFLSNFRIT